MTRALLLALLPLAACTQAQIDGFFAPAGTAADTPAQEAAQPAPAPTLNPTPPPPPPQTATTAEEFDTTSEEDRAAALAEPPAAEEVRLGTAIGSLGDAADPGIWIETGYVTELTWGRVEVASTGKTISLELRPSGGEPGAGAEVSLPAMRLLEVPFTELPELVIYELPGGAPA
ncbi:D-galactarate dehydratase [Pseudoroseicyclus tamaricis]|uniref:D-galactarate dehydratase n=1 Tax=Pseudoroseicyclus tamaricis TaxID=2705421 RepID=A0A6B2JU46_9RHOB|nr:D-galactarate dehydratase [Pseudoroseicyclus tamaricis]NDV00129.1 D-galactarate dehydratase [Pseudoroseicyclus tamaricis]